MGRRCNSVPGLAELRREKDRRRTRRPAPWCHAPAATPLAAPAGPRIRDQQLEALGREPRERSRECDAARPGRRAPLCLARQGNPCSTRRVRQGKWESWPAQRSRSHAAQPGCGGIAPSPPRRWSRSVAVCTARPTAPVRVDAHAPLAMKASLSTGRGVCVCTGGLLRRRPASRGTLTAHVGSNSHTSGHGTSRYTPLSRWWCCTHGLRLRASPPETVYTTLPARQHPRSSTERAPPPPGRRGVAHRAGPVPPRLPIGTLPALPALRKTVLVSRGPEITDHSADPTHLRSEATGSPARCQASMPPARTETVGKWCSRNSSAALTERPSVLHTVTMGRPRWGTSSLSRPSSSGKGSKRRRRCAPTRRPHSSRAAHVEDEGRGVLG